MSDQAASAGRGTISLRGVSKQYGDELAVHNIDLEVQAGEFLSLLGPSGCGKTTTLRMLAGFEEPDSGDIRISGVDVVHQPPYRRDVNTVFQSYSLFPHMSVAENVSYGPRQRRISKSEMSERVREALDLVKMSSYANRKPAQLSGGQQQRVALARALVNRPSVLLLDEPLAALDRKLREEMQVELKLLQQRLGITFVFVTHDQQEALSMSDRIAIMRDGQVQQIGSPDEVYDRPASVFVAGFVGQQNFFRGQLGQDPSVITIPEGRVVAENPIPTETQTLEQIVAVRPESMRVSLDATTPVENCARGTLSSTAHMGDVIQSIVTSESGTEIIVRSPRSESRLPEVGSTVWCAWDRENTLIFPIDQTNTETALIAAVS